MNNTLPRLGFFGFGQAAHFIARDLTQAGFPRMLGYSRSGARSRPGDPVYDRAQAAGVTLVRTVAALAKGSDVIIALTPGKAALPALKKILKHLRPDHLYIDASTNSASVMEQAATLVGNSAKFVDAAILAPVDLMGVKSPFAASGPHAAEFRDRMTPYGMVIKTVGSNAGDASAMKLIRSVFTKGMAAILLESMEAARRRNVLDEVAEDIATTFNEIPFEKIISRYISGTAINCERRIHEMKDCLELLHSMHSTDHATRATLKILRDLLKMDMPGKFQSEPPTIHPVLDAIIAARNA